MTISAQSDNTLSKSPDESTFYMSIEYVFNMWLGGVRPPPQFMSTDAHF